MSLPMLPIGRREDARCREGNQPFESDAGDLVPSRCGRRQCTAFGIASCTGAPSFSVSFSISSRASCAAHASRRQKRARFSALVSSIAHFARLSRSPARFAVAQAVKCHNPWLAMALVNVGLIMSQEPLDSPREMIEERPMNTTVEPPEQNRLALLSVDDLLAAGLAHHQAGRLTEAELHYQRLLAASDASRQANALYYLGVVAYQRSRPEMAIEFIDQAIQRDGANSTYHTTRGVVLLRLGDLEKALECQDQAVALDPDNVEVLNNRGLVLEKLARFEEALECYDQVLAIRPDFVPALVNRGNALQELQRFDEAIASYDRALVLAPNEYGAAYGRSVAELLTPKKDSAEPSATARNREQASRDLTVPAPLDGEPAPLLLRAYQFATNAAPLVRAGPDRDWMDATLMRAAYHCLPMVIANQHGWLLLNRHKFAVTWNGEPDPASLKIQFLSGEQPRDAVSIFGSGILTFAIGYLFRTAPGYNLHVRGPANSPKDGITALEGIVESDWTEASFTMNWKITRPNHSLVFEEGEPIAMISPLRRGEVERFRPELHNISEEPKLAELHLEWAASRAAFRRLVDIGSIAARWQHHYLRGLSIRNDAAQEHQTKLTLYDFADKRPSNQ
jgi:tetratricopeptide (TPR) repeat protein